MAFRLQPRVSADHCKTRLKLALHFFYGRAVTPRSFSNNGFNYSPSFIIRHQRAGAPTR